jgi:hypothetical protein
MAWGELYNTINDRSAFTVDAIPRPQGIRNSFKVDSAGSKENEMCWIIDQRDDPCFEASWIICVANPIAVIFILLSEVVSLEELALELAGHGVPFFMPMPFTLVQPAEDALEYRLQQERIGQIRPANYEFSTDDYLSYLRIFRTFVQEDPRVARLVLMSGGCPWRMARPFCDTDAVLNGPSGYAVSSIQDFSVRFKYKGVTLVEDRFLNVETCMLTGETKVPTHASQMTNNAKAAFLPPERLWLDLPHGHVGWNNGNESFLISKDLGYREIRKDDASHKLVNQPQTYSRWRNLLGNHLNAGKVLASVRSDALAFLSTHTDHLRG